MFAPALAPTGYVTLQIALGPFHYLSPSSSSSSSFSTNYDINISSGASFSTSNDTSTSTGTGTSTGPGLTASSVGVLQVSFLYSDPLDLALTPVVTGLTPSAAVAGGQGLGLGLGLGSGSVNTQGQGLGAGLGVGATTRGTVVVMGTGFLSTHNTTTTTTTTTTSTPTCWFGQLSVPALITSSTQLTCPCPVAVRPGSVDFTVMIGGVRSQVSDEINKNNNNNNSNLTSSVQDTVRIHIIITSHQHIINYTLQRFNISYQPTFNPPPSHLQYPLPSLCFLSPPSY